MVLYEKEYKVKIKRRTNYGPFLTMFSNSFDVGIWSPIEHSLLEVVATFLASGTRVKWSFLWANKTNGSTRDLYDLLGMIPVQSIAVAQCL